MTHYYMKTHVDILYQHVCVGMSLVVSGGVGVSATERGISLHCASCMAGPGSRISVGDRAQVTLAEAKECYNLR